MQTHAMWWQTIQKISALSLQLASVMLTCCIVQPSLALSAATQRLMSWAYCLHANSIADALTSQDVSYFCQLPDPRACNAGAAAAGIQQSRHDGL